MCRKGSILSQYPIYSSTEGGLVYSGIGVAADVVKTKVCTYSVAKLPIISGLANSNNLSGHVRARNNSYFSSARVGTVGY